MKMVAHPFAQYIQILGKGRRGARSLSLQEAEQALAMILSHQVEPVQLGAFLMLMRVKEETSEELAGFVRAARASLMLPSGLAPVDLDWACYAGKRRQLPWFLLSALLLASHGVAVLMHGVRGGSTGRVYVPQALKALGIEVAESCADAAKKIGSRRFAFVPLDVLNAELQHLLNLRSVLGLRSPVHTIVRMLNPFSAPASIMGIFHPGYDETHQQAGALLQDQHLAVFKGEGGEAERNPDTACKVKMLHLGIMTEEEWPAIFPSRHLKDEAMEVSRLAALWRGETEDEYGAASVVGTAAIVLRALGRAHSMADAEIDAMHLWDARDRAYLDSIQG
jgi:anthranilate phosphoribosyltransferase